MARIKKIISVGEDLGKVETLYSASGNIKWYSHFGKHTGGSLNS